jgi:hypothetical protein
MKKVYESKILVKIWSPVVKVRPNFAREIGTSLTHQLYEKKSCMPAILHLS